jgi:hypothetical protein
VNPLASHWLRLTLWLALATPVIALLAAWSTGAGFTLALYISVYVWAVVCAILALFAVIGLAARLVGRGIRALRR